MAEAATADQRAHNERFFCHQCSTVISPTLPEYTCPRCESGFIEVIDEEERVEQEDDPGLRFAEVVGQSLLDTLQRHGPPAADDTDNNSDSDADVDMGLPSRVRNSDMPRPFPRRSQILLRTRGPPGGGRTPAIENIVQQLLTGLTGGAIFGQTGTFPIGTMFNLYGNPGDYAWGAGGLDSIITQLLNQLDGTGPPPASKQKIETLPDTKITQEQVEKVLQCSVCMEDFALDEMVKRLPCNHHYHNDCIVPWLELHGTCPVCRKNLDGEDTTSGPAAGNPGIPDPSLIDSQFEFPPSSSSSNNSSYPPTSSSTPSQSSSSQDNRFDSIDEYD